MKVLDATFLIDYLDGVEVVDQERRVEDLHASSLRRRVRSIDFSS